MSDRQIIPADQIMPNRLFIMPLTGKPIFPGIFTPIMVQNEDDIEVIDKARIRGGIDKKISVILIIMVSTILP